jgi:tetratricopeptide (TPR) repeat protein
MESEDSLFKKALELRSQGKFEDSLRILFDLNLRCPDEMRVYFLIGNILSEQGKEDEAIAFYLRAVLSWPDDSTASLCLFHSLWHLKRFEEAFLEAVRFDHVNNLTEYVEILNSYNKTKFYGYSFTARELNLIQDQLDRYPISYRPPYEESDLQNPGNT